MNKKTYGEGVRVERVDHAVIAETKAAKEKLRDQLGHGEGYRTEELSRVEFLKRKLLEAGAKCDEASKNVSDALAAHGEAIRIYQQAGREYLAAKEEEERSA